VLIIWDDEQDINGSHGSTVGGDRSLIGLETDSEMRTDGNINDVPKIDGVVVAADRSSHFRVNAYVMA
jgi:hypothetical protein